MVVIYSHHSGAQVIDELELHLWYPFASGGEKVESA